MGRFFNRLLFALAIGATGCGPASLGERFARYQSEIENALGETGGPSGFRPIGLPRKRDRSLPLGDQRIRVLDFLALQGCSLGVLVGERNSPLGRVMQPVQRLGYEVEVLHVASACVEELSGERADRILRSLAVKRAELPTHRFHAVWNEAPMERYLGAATTPVLGGAEGDDLPSLVALRRALDDGLNVPKDVSALEGSLERLRDEEPLGGTLRSLDRATEALDRVAALMRRMVPKGSSCDAGAARLVRIFRERYLPLQAPLGAADRRASAALEELDRIYRRTRSELPAPPAAMDRYHETVLDPDAENGLWLRYRSALRRHAAAWAPTLERCGALTPVETRL